MSTDRHAPPPAEGLRARKHRETLARITDAGVSLFLEKGYQATTLDEIATAAGISRRTFFHYFKSKDDILLQLQSGMGKMIGEAVRRAPQDVRPLDAVRDAVLEICSAIPAHEMLALDRLMRSSDAVMARKQASYVEHENILFEALRERWPEREKESALRLVALLGVGAVRLSTERLHLENGERSLIDLLREAFDTLRAEI